MKKTRLQIGLDVDDILYDCNAYALELLNKKMGYEPPLTIYDIHSWGQNAAEVDARIAYFSDPAFVEGQPVLPGAREFVARLCEVADVFFVSAVPPTCMTARALRLAKDFPEVPTSHILLGHRKDLVQLDMLLDDAAHNISRSPASYPVLFRKPWNTHLSGLLSVTGYDDFLHLVDMLRNSFTDARPDLTVGGVVCLVGPTGTGKNEVAKCLVRQHGFCKPVTATTRPRREGEGAGDYRFLDEAQFLRELSAGEYLETTVYSGHHFGTRAAEIDCVCDAGRIAVLPIDICGALSLKNRYRSKALLVFMDRRRADVILDIVGREMAPHDKACRILSLDDEYRNEELCDCTVNANRTPAEVAAEIAQLLASNPTVRE